MKHFTVTLMAIGLVVFASPSGVSAQDGYNSNNVTATVSDSSPTAGTSFSVGVNNCSEDSATVAFQGSTKTTETNDADTATTSFTAPSTAGTHTGTATCGTTVSSFSVLVAATPTPLVAATPTPAVAAAPTPAVAAAAGGLPATGSSGSGTTIVIASVLLLAGVGMLGASQMRRRQIVG